MKSNVGNVSDGGVVQWQEDRQLRVKCKNKKKSKIRIICTHGRTACSTVAALYSVCVVARTVRSRRCRQAASNKLWRTNVPWGCDIVCRDIYLDVYMRFDINNNTAGRFRVTTTRATSKSAWWHQINGCTWYLVRCPRHHSSLCVFAMRQRSWILFESHCCSVVTGE